MIKTEAKWKIDFRSQINKMGSTQLLKELLDLTLDLNYAIDNGMPIWKRLSWKREYCFLIILNKLSRLEDLEK